MGAQLWRAGETGYRGMIAKIMAATVVSAATVLVSVAGAGADGDDHQQVSKAQFEILYNQCKYADTPKARESCRSRVKHTYRIGHRARLHARPRDQPAHRDRHRQRQRHLRCVPAGRNLDCRTYVGVTICGELKLNKDERECVEDSVKKGLGYRRAEVECYVYL